MRNPEKGAVVRVIGLMGVIARHGGGGLYYLLTDIHGLMASVREDFRAPLDQENVRPPLRPTMPYGKWTCADGREVLFNRDYRPIWERRNGGNATQGVPYEWVAFERQEGFYDDGDTPWRDRRALAKCQAILNAWGAPPSLTPPRQQWLDYLHEAERCDFRLTLNGPRHARKLQAEHAAQM
jgi:hypothetical protein